MKLKYSVGQMIITRYWVYIIVAVDNVNRSYTTIVRSVASKQRWIDCIISDDEIKIRIESEKNRRGMGSTYFKRIGAICAYD